MARGRRIATYFEARDVAAWQRIETRMRGYGAAGVVAGQWISGRLRT